ncbi:hypothetical protein HAX54_023425, partial [Datura stramonium]|nr:hypothetical protein [Datura stramonium]
MEGNEKLLEPHSLLIASKGFQGGRTSVNNTTPRWVRQGSRRIRHRQTWLERKCSSTESGNGAKNRARTTIRSRRRRTKFSNDSDSEPEVIRKFSRTLQNIFRMERLKRREGEKIYK